MIENKPETVEGVDFSNVREGDRLQFITRDTGFNGRGLYSRTGVVVKVTEKTVRVVCGNPAHYKPDTAVLRRADWHSRDVRRVVTEQPAGQPNEGDKVVDLHDGYTTCVYCDYTAKARKDGTMRKHRVAKDSGRIGSTGSLPQDPHGPICQGSGEKMGRWVIDGDGFLKQVW